MCQDGALPASLLDVSNPGDVRVGGIGATFTGGSSQVHLTSGLITSGSAQQGSVPVGWAVDSEAAQNLEDAASLVDPSE